MSFLRANTADEAVQLLAEGARPIAGGTDLVVGARQGKAPLPQNLVAIDRIAELGVIEATESHIRIGSGVTHAQLMVDPLIVDRLTGVADAAALVGSPATRNVGTVGGNIMNGSPAMDTGAPLMALGAVAELRSIEGTREVALTDLWCGPGRTTARPDELCTALLIPSPRDQIGSAYVRLEYRRAMEIAVVGAAACMALDAGVIVSIRLALTAVAPTIQEVTGLDVLIGERADDKSFAAIAELARDQAQPISDVRASDHYRRHTVGVMAQRAGHAAASRANGDLITVPVNRALGIGAAS